MDTHNNFGFGQISSGSSDRCIIIALHYKHLNRCDLLTIEAKIYSFPFHASWRLSGCPLWGKHHWVAVYLNFFETLFRYFLKYILGYILLQIKFFYQKSSSFFRPREPSSHDWGWDVQWKEISPSPPILGTGQSLQTHTGRK